MDQSINYFLEYENKQVGHLPIIDWARDRKRNMKVALKELNNYKISILDQLFK